jgi:hypothetical protein
MAEITYKWQVDSMNEDPILDDLENVVTYVGFSYVGTEPIENPNDPKSNYWIGYYSTNKKLSPPDPNNFKPLNELTESEVLSWVTGEYNVDDLKPSILQQINDQKHPTNIPINLPWNKKDV